MAALKFTATVRVAMFAACAFALVVTPLATVTVHSEPTASVAVAAVSVSVAVDVAEFDAVAVNVVALHPADVLTTPGDAMVNVGSTSAMLSLLVCTRGAFSSKVYDIDVGNHVLSRAITSRLVVRAGATVAVDFVSFTAAMSATLLSFSVTAAVRPLQSEG